MGADKSDSTFTLLEHRFWNRCMVPRDVSKTLHMIVESPTHETSLPVEATS